MALETSINNYITSQLYHPVTSRRAGSDIQRNNIFSKVRIIDYCICLAEASTDTARLKFKTSLPTESFFFNVTNG